MSPIHPPSSSGPSRSSPTWHLPLAVPDLPVPPTSLGSQAWWLIFLPAFPARRQGGMGGPVPCHHRRSYSVPRCPPGATAMELGNISQPLYGPGPEAPGSSTPGLVSMVHGFLRLVQPHGLPIGGCTGGCWGRGGGCEEQRGSQASLSPPAVVTMNLNAGVVVWGGLEDGAGPRCICLGPLWLWGAPGWGRHRFWWQGHLAPSRCNSPAADIGLLPFPCSVPARQQPPSKHMDGHHDSFGALFVSHEFCTGEVWVGY